MKRFRSATMSCLMSASVLAISASGAAAADAGQKNHSGSELHLNLYSEPMSLDPAIGEDSISFALLRATFDGLTRTGEDGKLHPSAAEKIDVSDDGKTYTFHLRSAKWSNGDPVTAHDFEYAWKRAIDPKIGAGYAYQFYVILNAEKANLQDAKLDDVGIKAIDDRTLRVTLEKPAPYFLELTALPVYYPVNKKVAEASQGWAWEANTHVGNGPFKVESWDHKKSIVLAKNQAYWDKAAVKLDKLSFSMVEDEATELSMYKNGELDWAGGPLGSFPADEIPALKKSGELRTQVFAGAYWYKFNTEQAPFQNAKIRKAFAYAINRQALIDDVLQTAQLPATAIVPPVQSLVKEGYFKDNDVTQAKALLAEGMKELGITQLPPITLTYNTSDAHQAIARFIQSEWKKNLGVDVKLENKEWKQFLDDLHEGRYQIGRFGWIGDYSDPVNFLELFKEKNGSLNDTHWESPKYKALLEQSATESDPEKRTAILKQAEQILMDEMPVMPIYYYTNSWIQNEKLSGVVIDPLGTIDYKWAHFTN